MPIDFLNELRWRGLLHQATDEQALGEHLADPDASPRKAYAGFDPTSDSLTIGNLVPIMLLVHFARAGHDPVVLMGGGTGLIGDPSGKSAERTLMTDEQVADNVRAQRGIFERVFGNAGVEPPTIVNNLDWLGKLGYIEALRDVGKHFSVNMMMQKDSVRDRLQNREQGISYTEFSYMILQAYDFAHLYKHDGVTIQLGGSDQYGNIVAGTDLIKKQLGYEITEFYEDQPDLRGDPESIAKLLAQLYPAIGGFAQLRRGETPVADVFGTTAPLVTKADGGKFGKTESGAVWLTAPTSGEAGDESDARTSPYNYYQFWLNADDRDVGKFLRIYTLLSEDEIEDLERAHAEAPGKREAHRALAHHATSILHGTAEADAAEAAARALFSGEIADLPEATFRDVFAGVPSTEHAKGDLGGDFVQLLVDTTLASSKRQAREFLENGSVSVNGTKVSADFVLSAGDLLHGHTAALRRGKKAWHITRWR